MYMCYIVVFTYSHPSYQEQMASLIMMSILILCVE